MNNNYKINGYDVRHTYAGIDQYTVSKDGEEIGTCWSIGAVAELTKTTPEIVRAELYK